MAAEEVEQPPAQEEKVPSPIAEAMDEAVASVGMEAEGEEPVGVAEPEQPVAEEAAPVAEGAVPEAVGPVSREAAQMEGPALEEVELESPFEGEPIEDSLGWVSTEPPEEFQYDWEEPAWEEVEAEKEDDWEPEELEEFRKEKKKKGRKKRGRSDFDYELDDLYDPKWR